MRPETTFSGPALCARPARDIVAGLRRGEIDPADLIEAAASRIAQTSPTINATVTACPDYARAALGGLAEHAATMDAHPGWLGGLPVGIKDLNPVRGVRSTWGNTALAEFIPEATDPLVERLEARGALVIGKTNTPEMGAGGNSTNAVFGSTRNPWNTAMNAGGSSGGSAAALAAGEVWLAQGSDLMGSLRTPAAHCSVLGLRPSPGRCGGAPAAAAFLPEAVQGPMARDVRDLALFLDAMCGRDDRLPLSLDEPATPFQTALVQAPRPPRIAFSEDQNGFAPVERDIRAGLNAAMQAVARAGATVETACPDLPGLNETYLALRGQHYATVVGNLPPEVQAAFGPRVRENLAYGRAVTGEALCDAALTRSKLYGIMRGFLTGYDVLALPVVGIAPAPVEEEYPRLVDGADIGTYEDWLRFSFLAPTTTLPALSMPAGFTPSGLPIGLQLIGPPHGEAVLLQTALFIEEALALPAAPIDPRTPPT